MKGDKGNSVGSAGASNSAGDGKGGQVNLDHVGGKTGNVLRQVNGQWSVVDKATGAVRDPHTGAALSQPKISPAAYVQPTATVLPRPKPAVPASVPLPQMKPALPASAVPLDPQIAGRAQAAAVSQAARVQSTMAAKSTREDAIAAATHNMVETHLNNTNPTVGNQNKSIQYGVGTAKESPITRNVDASLPGRAAEAARTRQAAIDSELRNQGVQGGAGVQAYEGGPAKTAVAPANPFDAVYRDPQIAGRLADARRPGAGVPDLPTRGQTVNKTPAITTAPNRSVQQVLNDMIHRNAGIAYPGTETAVPSASLGAPQPAGPEGQAPGVVSTNPNVPIPREKPVVGIGEALRAIAPVKDQSRAYPDAPIENAAVPGQIGTNLTQGLPQMQPAPETAQQKLASIMHQWTQAQAANNALHLNTPTGDIRTLDPGIVEPVGDSSYGSTENKPPVGTNAPTAASAPVASSNMFKGIGDAISGAVNEGMDQFHIASDKIEAIGGPAVATGLSKFVQSLNVSPGKLGSGNKDLAKWGAGNNGNSNGNGSGTASGHDSADWEGKGFTDAEIANLVKLKGDKYTKELARLLALHAGSTTGPAMDYTAMLHQYEADKQRILAGNGYGLIPI